MTDIHLTSDVWRFACEVYDERKRQLDKWGEQSWPVLAGTAVERVNGRAFFAQLASNYQRQNDKIHATDKDHDWAGILLEEVYEALGEPDPVERRKELVQIAAVVQAIIEDEDRKVAEDRASL